MPSDFQTYSDQDLIELFAADPASQDGRAAQAVLQYRQYLAIKRNNALLVVFTALLVVATLIQGVSAAVQAYAMWRNVDGAAPASRATPKTPATNPGTTTR